MKLRKLLSLSLVLVMTFTVLAGCSGSSSSSSSSASSETSSTSESSTDTSEVSSEASSDSSASSESSEASSEPASSYLITDQDVTLRLIRSDNSNQPMQLGNEVLQTLESTTGVTLEIEAIAGSDFTTKTETIIATGSPYDIMYDCYYVANYAGQGAFLDISGYLNDGTMPNIKALFDEYPDMYKLYTGDALYQIPVMSRNALRMGRSPQIRQDLLEETGMETPTTYDELMDVLKAIKENHPEMYPIGNRNGSENLLTCYAYSFGTGYGTAGIYYEPTQEAYVCGPLSEEFMTMLQWFQDAYTNGILDPDYAVVTSTQWQERLSSGQNCFYYDNPTFASNFNAALAATDPNARFAPLEVPSSGSTHRGLYYSKHDMGATVINADTEYPEICCKFMDFLYSDYGCDLTNFGIEGETFEYNEDGEPELLESAIEEYKDASDPMRAFFGAYSLAKLGIARYIDDNDQIPFLTEESAEWYSLWESWDFMDEPVVDPSFTTEESEELADLRTSVTDTITTNLDAFIMGQRPVSEWVEVQDQIRDDATRICEIYNEANARTAQ